MMSARILMRLGVAMLILSLLVRPAIHDKGAMMGDNLAIIVCLVVIATGVIGSRIGRRIDPDLAEQMKKKAQKQKKEKKVSPER